MRIISNDVTRMLFKKVFFEDFNEFQQHVQRLKNQYGESMILKTVWQSTHVLVQMDFGEDYKCSDIVEPAYWNLTLVVTIHPVAIYFKQNNSLVQQGERFCRLFL